MVVFVVIQNLCGVIGIIMVIEQILDIFKLEDTDESDATSI